MSSEYQPVTVADCREIAERRAKDQVVIVTVDHEHNRAHVSTWGRSAFDKFAAAGLSDRIFEHVFDDPDDVQTFEDFRLDAAKLKARVEELEDLLKTACAVAADTRSHLETVHAIPRLSSPCCDLLNLEQRARELLYDGKH